MTRASKRVRRGGMNLTCIYRKNMRLSARKKLKKMFHFWRYQQEQKQRLSPLITPFILGGITLGIGVISIVSYWVVRGIILQQLQEKALLQVRQGSDEIDQWLAIGVSEIQTLANTETVRSLNWLRMEPYLKTEIRRTDFFSLALSHSNGSYYTTQVGKALTNNKDRDFIQKAIAGQTNISDPFISRSSGMAVIAIASPVLQNSNTKRPIAAFTGTLKVYRVSQVVNQLHYGNGSYAFALNSQGQAIVHPNRSLMSTVEKPAPSFLESPDHNIAAIAQRMVNKQQGIELIPIDGTQKYVAHVPLQQANWSIALVIPRENIESQLGALNLLASILGGLLIIAVVFVWRQIQLSEQSKAQIILLSQQKKILRKQAQELEQTLQELQQTQIQLIQTEKMSSLGSLVAGVAHEINNPISFIYGNLSHAQQYTQDLLQLVQLYQKHYPHPITEIQNDLEAIEFDFVMQDLPKLFNSMQVGADRIKQIVLSLRNFSRLDEAEMKVVNIHEGIDSTLLILESRFKATSHRPAITIIKKYSEIPPVECFVGQLNQVFMNILNNAVDALEESVNSLSLVEDKRQITNPQILIQTALSEDKQVKICIADNGVGIPENILPRLFDPFFTTKPVGKGTGLGLSISYQIITEKHRGNLRCISSCGQGAEFIITIPLHQ